MKYLAIFFLCIVLVSQVSASGAAAATSIAHQQSYYTTMQQGVGCSLPLDYAKEHSCQLSYPGSMDKRVGAFMCGSMNILTDCQGNIIEEQDISKLVSNQFFSLGIVLFTGFTGLTGLIVVLFIITLIFHIARKIPKRKVKHEN